MVVDLEPNTDLPAKQQAIKAKCFHPSGTFVEFKEEEIEQSIPARFEQQVAKYPGRIAVKTRNYAFTYDELNRAANRVARAILAERGEGEEPIALLFEHDVPMIAAILGVWKAGKFYVSLDPSLPHARISYVLDDSQTNLILTDNKNFSLAKELAQNRLLLLNIERLEAALSDGNLGLSVSPNCLAYLLYTSGSTGQPKGVVNNHRNVLHNILIRTNTIHICAQDRLTLFSFSTGQAVKNILGALLNGAALYPFDVKKGGLVYLTEWLIGEEVTIYLSSSSLYRRFVETLTGREKFPNLRLIRLGSESLTRRDIELYKRHFSPSCILVNGLSTTESGTVRKYFIDKQIDIVGDKVPVGYPVDDKEVLLLDDTEREVGLNEVGEIAVKGRYLCPSYWRRPDLTQAKFLPDPNGGDRRIYLTGDLGRMMSDGCLEHLGRKDFRAKIRGYGVEVTEIETALMTMENIKEAVVVAREEQGEERRLVAYIVPTIKTSSPTITLLRSALREKLPDYMIPSAFVILDAMPMTPNGKVDRRALPAPDQSRPELESPFVTPRSPVEEALARIWAEVLKLEQVGVHDNFLDLGGDSLLATKLISRLREELQMDLPFRVLFESPTIAQLAAWADVAAGGVEVHTIPGDHDSYILDHDRTVAEKLIACIEKAEKETEIRTMRVKEVPSDHDFFDPAYVKHWSDSITRYRPERKKLFKAFAAEAARMKKGALSVFELGCGPGFLAEALLENCDIARYTLVDFSPAMLKLSRSRLAKYKDRTVFIQADFKKETWTDSVPAGFDLILSLQAVHELRHASRVPKLYSQLRSLLAPGGTILICDHVNSLSGHRAAHFMTVKEHLSTFEQVGFIKAREICPAADLSLMAAEKP